jgi:biopolymer transport protein ExbD
MGTKRHSFNEINITPLTDIFLVLLIIMMVIAPMLDSQGLKLSVPALGSAPETSEKPKTLTVKVLGQGSYIIEGRPYPKAALKQVLQDSKAQHPDGLIIEADPQSTHGAVMQLMDAARQINITKIAVTEG